jgi:hypothetical protein
MKTKNATVTLILILFILVYAALRWHVLEPHKKEVFDRHPVHLIYTHHALCRMGCRHITKDDITYIMHKGIIFLNKTNLHDRPCPTFALQGYTKENEDIRVIFAQCDSITKVVTCYNLHKDFACHCPGDENSSY